ncbi:hypothetical protein F4780DRAFT_765954 [Xylariomycetidae sp. FL0641]|nr:hypothetical protein F4780DRAFT_765954 [Xylariomycetidae sp. FL0641]
MGTIPKPKPGNRKPESRNRRGHMGVEKPRNQKPCTVASGETPWKMSIVECGERANDSLDQTSVRTTTVVQDAGGHAGGKDAGGGTQSARLARVEAIAVQKRTLHRELPSSSGSLLRRPHSQPRPPSAPSPPRSPVERQHREATTRWTRRRRCRRQPQQRRAPRTRPRPRRPRRLRPRRWPRRPGRWRGHPARPAGSAARRPGPGRGPPSTRS